MYPQFKRNKYNFAVRMGLAPDIYRFENVDDTNNQSIIVEAFKHVRREFRDLDPNWRLEHGLPPELLKEFNKVRLILCLNMIQ